MNKKPKLTKEQKFLMLRASKEIKNIKRLSVVNSQIRTGKITMSKTTFIEKIAFDILTTENATERFGKLQEAYQLMQKELNEI